MEPFQSPLYCDPALPYYAPSRFPYYTRLLLALIRPHPRPMFFRYSLWPLRFVRVQMRAPIQL